MAIAALRAGTGSDHVAHASQSGKGLCPAAHRYAKPGDFGQTSGDQAGAGIVTRTLTITHAHGNGDNIFQDATEFAADHIGVSVSSEQTTFKYCLQFLYNNRILHCDHAGCCLPGYNFLCQVWPGKDAHRVSRQYLGNDFCHAHTSV